MFNVTRSNVGIVWYSGISGGSEQLPPLLIAWLPYYNLLRRRRCKWIPLCCANSQVMWMNSQDVQEDHMGGVSPITRLRSNQTNDHTSTPFHHSFSLLSHLPSYKLYLKSTLLFNLKKYIFLHFILFTLIMSTSLFVILKQLFIPYCSFTPTYD